MAFHPRRRNDQVLRMDGDPKVLVAIEDMLLLEIEDTRNLDEKPERVSFSIQN
jgi:hypothetical protein